MRPYVSVATSTGWESTVITCLLCVLSGLSAPQPVFAIGISQSVQEKEQQRLRESGFLVVPSGAHGVVKPPDRYPSPNPAGAGAKAAGQSMQIAVDALGASYTYDSVGNRESAIYPNGMVTLYKHDRRNRLTELHTSRNGATIHRYNYTLDPSGLRTRVDAVEADGATRTTTYTYDAVKRLTGETQARNG